jgi:hypothetical protein
METKRAYLLFKLFGFFIAILFTEYIFSSIYFRLVRHSDFLIVDFISGISAISICYWICRKWIKTALKEQVPRVVVAAVFLICCFLVACFLRFSIQLTNGLLDSSPSETQTVVVTGKKISALGGSFKEGPSPMAHLVYFGDWDNGGGICDLLTPPAIYYTVGPGSRMEISVRKGLLHLAWVEDFQIVGSLMDRYQLPGN